MGRIWREVSDALAAIARESRAKEDCSPEDASLARCAASLQPTVPGRGAPDNSGKDARHNILWVQSVAWDVLHSGMWRCVRVEWRDLFLAASCLLVATECGTDPADAVAMLDLGLMMGASRMRGAAAAYASRLCASASRKRPRAPTQEYWAPRVGMCPTGAVTGVGTPVRSTGVMGLHAFETEHLQPQCVSARAWFAPGGKPRPARGAVIAAHGEGGGNPLRRVPVVMRGAVTGWPAVDPESDRCWARAQYLLGLMGHRLVPVEEGRSYTSAQWRQSLVPFSEFLHRCTQGSAKARAKGPGAARDDEEGEGEEGGGGGAPYLAQHPLLEQVPQLQQDIVEPDYCSLRPPGTGGVEGGRPLVNAWLGPAGTVSDLHQDPYDNCLCQVAGAKLVLLHRPGDRELVYPRGGALSNTSRVDPEAVDARAFPRYADAARWAAVLRAGDLCVAPGQGERDAAAPRADYLPPRPDCTFPRAGGTTCVHLRRVRASASGGEPSERTLARHVGAQHGLPRDQAHARERRACRVHAHGLAGGDLPHRNEHAVPVRHTAREP